MPQPPRARWLETWPAAAARRYYAARHILATRHILAALILGLACLLAYGLWIPWLHLYIDDWIWVWSWETGGRAGLARYFAGNRPPLALLYQLTLPLLGQNVLAFHVFALLARWASGLAAWWLVRLVWPARPRRALAAALLFVLYPGFRLQPIALTYGHIFLLYAAFLLSLGLALRAARSPRRAVPLTALALLLSALNLISLEYFFTLELARPLLIWAADGVGPRGRARLRWVLRRWLPYLLLFGGAGVYRVAFANTMTARYPLDLLAQLRLDPAAALLGLARSVAASLWQASFGAWVPAVERLLLQAAPTRTQLAALALAAAAAGVVFGALALARRAFPPGDSDAAPSRNRRDWLSPAALGLALLLLAGWPYWLTGLTVLPTGFESRFTLPFFLGAALLFAALLELLRPAPARALALALLAGLACGYHFLNANTFRIEAEQNRQLMWQIHWRIPNLREGTTLLLTDYPVTVYNTATLSTELNLLYPVVERAPDLGYFLLIDREQDEFALPGGLVPGVPIVEDNVTARFSGSTSQVLSAQYSLGQCFRLLDPTLDGLDATLHPSTRRAALLSRWDWVTLTGPPAQPPAQWFGAEPQGQWCFYFEKAELARQQGDWPEAARLGDAAWAADLAPRDEMEKLVFIEAYARTGQRQRAVDLSLGFAAPEKLPVLCALWQRIAGGAPVEIQAMCAGE